MLGHLKKIRPFHRTCFHSYSKVNSLNSPSACNILLVEDGDITVEDAQVVDNPDEVLTSVSPEKSNISTIAQKYFMCDKCNLNFPSTLELE